MDENNTSGFRSFVGAKHRESKRLVDLIDNNIDVLLGHEEKKRQSRHPTQKVADWIAEVSGSMGFVIFHAAFFMIWILANAGAFGLKRFDPFPYGLLTTIVSLEAIFLSLFVLIAQNRMQYESDRRAELDLQINLLTEYEVTHVLRMVNRIAEKLEIGECDDPELTQLEKAVDPQVVIEEIEAKREKNADG